jgi:thymidylate synthase
MNKADIYYLNNIREISDNGEWDENPRPKWKDGTPAHSKYITQVFEEYNIDKGEFPITTLRNTAIKMGIKEILWIYQQQSNKLSDAHELGITWWDEWDVGDETIGGRYGATVKKWDLMNKLLEKLESDPYSRRHIINLYQQFDLDTQPGLFPCAYETLWSVRKIANDFYLDLTMIQRSNDYITAGYINKIQYVALQMMVAGHLGYKPGKFCHLTQNLHIYDRHFEAVTEILTRKPLNEVPKLILKENKNFYDYTIDDFIIEGTEGIQKLSTKLEIAV